MPVPSPKRGARPSPRSALAAAIPHVIIIGAPPNMIMVPPRISMWGNGVHGDCVTAEEAFAKACNSPEIFIPDNDVIAWATRHGVLEGAYLTNVMQWMQNDGFPETPYIYDDGQYFSVDWTDSANLQSAISRGPVKIGVAADQIEAAWQNNQGQTGWFGFGFAPDNAEDHCVSLCGYGTLAWLAQQLNVQVPPGIDGTQPGYAMFTWNSIGIIDTPSMIAITHEAWLRQPTTVTKSQVAKGDVWGINAAERIYQWNGTAWTQIPSALVTIAVNAGQVWGINAAQQIYNWNGTAWTQIPGALTSIAVGSDGQVWGINAAQQIYNWIGTGWTQIPGALVTIAVNGGQVWGINAAQQIYQWNGTAWTQIPGALTSIAVGPDGQVWGINAAQQIYNWNGMAWTQIPGALVTIAIG